MCQADKPKVMIVCRACGGDNVRRDAWAEWRPGSQSWELGAVFDQGYCDDCDGEARLIERPLTADELADLE